MRACARGGACARGWKPRPAPQRALRRDRLAVAERVCRGPRSRGCSSGTPSARPGLGDEAGRTRESGGRASGAALLLCGEPSRRGKGGGSSPGLGARPRPVWPRVGAGPARAAPVESAVGCSLGPARAASGSWPLGTGPPRFPLELISPGVRRSWSARGHSVVPGPTGVPGRHPESGGRRPVLGRSESA